MQYTGGESGGIPGQLLRGDVPEAGERGGAVAGQPLNGVAERYQLEWQTPGLGWEPAYIAAMSEPDWEFSDFSLANSLLTAVVQDFDRQIKQTYWYFRWYRNEEGDCKLIPYFYGDTV